MLKIYKCGELYDTFEKEQLQAFIDKVYYKFDPLDYNVYIVIDPKLGRGKRQIDCIFYRKNKLAIIELKNIRGEFFPNASESDPWEGLDQEGKRVKIENERINPFLQVRHQRRNFSDFIEENFYQHEREKDKRETHDQVMKLILGFIVTAENSTPNDYDKTNLFWCTLLPIGEELMKKLSFVGTGEKYGISEETFLSILEKIKAVETDRHLWSYGTKAPENMLSKVPEVESRLGSYKEEILLKGIENCSDLKLIPYFDRIFSLARGNYSEKVKTESYKLVFEWLTAYQSIYGLSYAENALMDSINENSSQIRSMALEFVVNGTYLFGDQLQQKFSDRLDKELSFQRKSLLLKSMEFFNDKKFTEYKLKTYYEETVSSHLFGQYRETWELIKKIRTMDITQRAKDLRSGDNGLSKKYEDASKQYMGWIEVAKSWLDAVKSNQSPVLLQMVLEHLRKVVDLWNEAGKFGGELPPTFIECLEALEKLQPPGTSEYIYELLSSTKDENLMYHLIGSAGKISITKAAGIIEQYLNFDDEESDVEPYYMRLQAADALSRMGQVKFFDKIWNLYLSDDALEHMYSEETFNLAGLDKSRQSDNIEHLFSGETQLFEILTRLNKGECEKRILKLMVSSHDIEEFSVKHLFLLKNCGGKETFETVKALLLNKPESLDDWYWDFVDVVVHIFAVSKDLKSLGVKTGLQFLETGREDLVSTGLELAHSHFLKHPEELKQYEKSQDGATLFGIIDVYDTCNMIDDVERFLLHEDDVVSKIAFDVLEEHNEHYHYFENYYIVSNGNVDACDILVGNGKMHLKIKRKYGKMAVGRKSANQTIKSENLYGLKTLRKKGIPIGMVIGVKGNDSNNAIALFKSPCISWNHLIGDNRDYSPEVDSLKTSVLALVSANKEIGIITATDDYLFNFVKLAYRKSLTDLWHRDPSYIESRLETFDTVFKSEMFDLGD